MITTLHIKNIGIIEDLTIDLNKGLNVLTGETGAGKTLIIDSLQIISGGRFSKDMIRRGENNSFVELCMYDPKNEKSEDGNIIVSREINLNGKNMCKINGRMVTVNELRTFMKEFIEIHGQNDNQNLLDNKLHLQYLDGFIGEKIESNLNKYYILYEKYNKIKSELKDIFGDEKEYWLASFINLFENNNAVHSLPKNTSNKEWNTPSLLMTFFEWEELFLKNRASKDFSSFSEYLSSRKLYIYKHK